VGIVIEPTDNAFNTISPNKFNTMWIQNPNNSSNFIHSIIKNDDAANKKYTYKKIDDYIVLNHIPPETIQNGKEDWEVEYSYNSDLFRSDHFKKNHEGLHILFGGCSNTEGVGSNITDNWSYLLYQEISKHTATSGFFSIAKGGNGWHQILLNFKVYVEKYGAPDYYLVLHPDIMRFYEWKTEKGQWKYSWQYAQKNIGDGISKKEYEEKHKEIFPHWVSAMSIFIAYCESVGTKFIWTTWDNREHENIKNSHYFDSSYFETYFGTSENVKSIRPDGKFEKDDLNFRDGHPGKIQQILWFKSFKDELIKRKEIFK
jgi:hypothetical protein